MQFTLGMCGVFFWRDSRNIRALTPFLRHAADQLPGLVHHIAEVLPAVGKGAAGAVLDPALLVGIASPTVGPQGVEGAVAEQAVEAVWILGGVAGEVFTVLVAEEGVLLPLPAGGLRGAAGFRHGVAPL